ncbi:unnamed protein product, partial [Rotaria sp. Silwood2]
YINEIGPKQIVQWNDVIWRILTYFHIQDLGNVGVQRAEQMFCIDNLILTQNKINIYLDAYPYWHTIGTLFGLEYDFAPKQVHVKSIYQLGIRMKSAYLTINVRLKVFINFINKFLIYYCIKTMQANHCKAKEIARTELNYISTDLVQNEIEKQFQKLLMIN